jgi:molecular chaperone GrpE
MNKELNIDTSWLQELAFQYPNDFQFGNILRKILTKKELEKEEVDNSDTETKEEIDYKQLYIRLSADFDNYRKRTLKEREEITLRTKASVLDSIMDLDSDVSIASESIKDEQAREGMKLILNKVNKFLSNNGIESIQNETYNPEEHEVVHILTEGSKEIKSVVSKGYKSGDKILRYSKVVIK